MKVAMNNGAVISIASQEIAGSHDFQSIPIDGVLYEGMYGLKLFGQHIVRNKSPGTNFDCVINAAASEGDHWAVLGREIDHLQQVGSDSLIRQFIANEAFQNIE